MAYPRNDQPRSSAPFLLFLLLILAGVLAYQNWPARGPRLDENAKLREIVPRGSLADDEKATIDIYKLASPSVVHVTSLRTRQSLRADVQRIPEGTGSGFVWDKEGHVLTNYHVIQNADAAQVTLADVTTWDAKVVGAYPDLDLAVLWIDAPSDQLIPIPLGTSKDLVVGQKVFAIGNPFGLDQTLTTGVISAVGREIQSVTARKIRGVIQTDAAINPGNSGGPLLDSAGRLIGVNTAIVSPSGSWSGIGFAIPVDDVNRVATQLLKKGKISRPFLGVELVPDAAVKKLGLTGALVMNVTPNSPAEKAGLNPTQRDKDGRLVLGDVIQGLGSAKIRSNDDLFSALEQQKTGDEVVLTLERNGSRRQQKITLGEVP